MTGFGLSSSIDVGAEVYVEIKGVNHRFLEISIKPNDLDNELDDYFRKVKKEFNIALMAFVDARKKEGNKIKKVLIKKINSLEVAVLKISKVNKVSQKKRLKVFKLKIANLIKDVDETRVNQELALLALKHDVSEELDRIIFHTKSMNQELKKQSCSGKKIDFILQELFREANTLSVKLDDPNSKNLALDAKLLVEEMREQIQNVE